MFEGIRTVNSTVTIFLGRKLQKEEFLCIARSGVNSVYNPKRFHAIIFQFHTTPKKHITALLFESGKVIFTGGKNETESKKAIRKLLSICNWAFSKSKIPRVCINDVNVRNVVFAGKMPNRMQIEKAFLHFRDPLNAPKFAIKRCRYDPSIFPGLRIATIHFTLIIFIILNYTVDSQQIGMYNLSKNYQLHENYIAMRIILPMDIAYLFFILIFNILVILLRNNRLNMSLAIFLGHYNMLSCLLTLYTIISLSIYCDFLLLQSGTSNGTWLRGKRRNARANNVLPMEQIGQLYFNQLKHQWEDCVPNDEFYNL